MAERRNNLPRGPGNSLLRAISDPEFYRRELGRHGVNALRGLASGIVGAPVDLATVAMRPLGYSTPQDEVVGSSEWIGNKLGADTDSASFIAGSLGPVPDVSDVARVSPAMAAFVAKRLPRDVAPLKVREQRADEAGFDEQTVFHGTADDIEEFMLSQGGRATQSEVGQLGVSLADDPDVASEFASRAASGRGGGGENILPVRIRAQKRGVIELDGTERDREIAVTVKEAWDDGFDSIRFDNYTTQGGLTDRSFTLVRDPSQIRSVHADFDPEKIDKADLLAGGAGAAVGLGVAREASKSGDNDDDD